MEPRRIDNYRILSELGSGGMAVVYRARDEHLDRDVALKILHEHIAARADNRERFEREARAVARLRHPNIITIYAFSSSAAPVGYIAAELVDGPNLREFIERGPLPLPELAAMIGVAIADALAHAHDAGIIHRDIKPENVMIGADGIPKLMDFGLARVLDSYRMTVTGSLVGSPAHMSPELIEGGAIDERADVFALGTVLYFLMTGALPFDGNNPAAVLHAILSGRFSEPSVLNPRVGRRLSQILARCLARDPDERYGSAREVRDALRAYLTELGFDNPSEEFARWYRNRQALDSEYAQRIRGRLGELAERALEQGRVAAAVARCDHLLALDPADAVAERVMRRIHDRRRRRSGLAVAAAAMVLSLLVVFLWRATREDPETLSSLRAPVGSGFAGSGEAAPTPEQSTEPAIREATLRVERSRVDGEAASGARPAASTIARGIAEAAAELARLREPIGRRRPGRPPITGRPVADPAVPAGPSIPAAPLPAGVPSPVPPAEVREVERRSAWLELNIWPRAAEVYVDGVLIGQSGGISTLEVKPGRRRIRARHKSMGDYVERVVDVDEGQRVRVAFDVPWPPAQLVVEARQPSTVFIDDRQVGRTGEMIRVPIEGREPDRRVKVRVIPTGGFVNRPFEQTVTLRAGTRTPLTAPF